MRKKGLLTLSLVVVAFLATATQSAQADLISQVAFGHHMDGGVVVVTFTESGNISALIFGDEDFEEGFAFAPGHFQFAVEGETFANNWILHNLSANKDDFITVIDIRLAGTEVLFDDDSNPSTPNSIFGVQGAEPCLPPVFPLCGPTPLVSFEAIAWQGIPGPPSKMNEGDMFEREFILFSDDAFPPGSVFHWHDDLDRIVSEPDDSGCPKRPELNVADLIASLDIKPGSCPNSWNRNSNGVLPVGLLGTKNFDVTQVDISSLRISRADGVGGCAAPNEGPPGPHTVQSDVGTPFNGEACDCHELEGDGVVDLSIKFKTQEVVEALQMDDFLPGASVELCVSGETIDGDPFEACDCVRLVPPGDVDGDGIVGVVDLLLLLAEWGLCGPAAECAADYNGDVMVGVVDLMIMFGNWG